MEQLEKDGIFVLDTEIVTAVDDFMSGRAA